MNKGSIDLENVTLQNGRCTVSGCAINYIGTVYSKKSTIQHFGSSKVGEAIFASKGKLKFDHSKIIGKASGVGVTTDISA